MYQLSNLGVITPRWGKAVDNLGGKGVKSSLFLSLFVNKTVHTPGFHSLSTKKRWLST
ncbi:unannotated protein [freshwater metagenome]|uniref:Unannotated protein n=1 Tax=freshwater metagenome TaxID=449393 RepID=A0A6J7M3R4_9ZZZZ